MPQPTHTCVYRSTSMEALADRLIDTIAEEQRSHGLFHRTPVIVPNKSMERYLTIRFAARKGIESGITFPFLMSMFGRTHTMSSHQQ